jgi:protein-S-isoprenylcysteine O-methyltransferase Ste14
MRSLTLKSKLFVQTVAGLAFMGGMLFLTARTFDYWEAWVFIAILFIPMVTFSAYFYKHDRAVLERRMQKREKRPEQRRIMRAAALVTLLGFVVPGLDHRFGWTRRWLGGVPLWLEIAGQALTLAGYVGAMWVVDVNRFASRTIQVEQGQKVVSSGPYHVVRHPMYSCWLVMWLSMGPALGSYVAMPVLALLIPVLVFRLLNEEKVLRAELPGYEEYRRLTPHRLIPYIW